MKEEKRRKNSKEHYDFALFRHRPEQNFPDGEDYEENMRVEQWKTYVGLGLIIVIVLIISAAAIRARVIESKEVTSPYLAAEPVVEADTGMLVQTADAEAVDLYEMARKLGFTGTREAFYTLLADRNADIEDIRNYVDELKQIIGQLENEQNEKFANMTGKVGKDGKDGMAGRDGADGKDGATGKTGATGAAGRAGAAGRDGIDGQNGVDGKDGIDGQTGVDGKDGIDGQTGAAGKDGIDGQTGVAGKDGINGQNGIDGQDGADGKSTFIAYAEDASGNGFSLAPTENSKYIGTYTAATASRPANPQDYSWQLYRSYIITEVTENGTTTLYIR